MTGFKPYLLITGNLVVVTPLMLGSGENLVDGDLPELDADNGGGDGRGGHPNSARIQIDACGKPYLPGSSLKGAMKGLCADPASPSVKALFGTIKNDNSGQMGQLIVYGAEWKAPPESSALPLSQKEQKKAKGVGIIARTAIDQGRGTTQRNKLFYSEAVPPGAMFKLRMRFDLGGATDDVQVLLGSIVKTLESEGLTLGRGGADGNGRLKLENATCEHYDPINSTCEPFPLTDACQAITLPGDRYHLTLTCEGPFFVQDWSHERKQHEGETRKERKEKERNDETAALAALRDPARSDRPALPGESLMGALRARAEWLAKCRGKDEALTDILFGPRDTREGGRKAALVIDELSCTNAGILVNPTSIRLDRFSGGPIDGALFKVACYANPAFQVHLRLRPTNGGKEAKDFLEDVIIADLTRNGLKLGHATNRGFGWFRIAVAGGHVGTQN